MGLYSRVCTVFHVNSVIKAPAVCIMNIIQHCVKVFYIFSLVVIVYEGVSASLNMHVHYIVSNASAHIIRRMRASTSTYHKNFIASSNSLYVNVQM